jgi:uncharacterized integral membrane protein
MENSSAFRSKWFPYLIGGFGVTIVLLVTVALFPTIDNRLLSVVAGLLCVVSATIVNAVQRHKKPK